jgi:hypothetical protein
MYVPEEENMYSQEGEKNAAMDCSLSKTLT